MINTPASLLERLREPTDPEAWDRFVSLYTPLMLAWSRHVGLQENDAEDLVQDVFVKLIGVLPFFNYDARKGFRSWLRTVTLNTWRDRCKHAGNRLFFGDKVELADIAAPNNDESFWDVEFRQHVVNRAMTLMRTDFQPAAWKAFWEQVVVGRLAREVAAELGMTLGAAYAAKFRVLARLRQELAGMLE